MAQTNASTFRRFLIMVVLIMSGEAVFLLPFVFARIFRPTMLDVFGLTNFELGTAFSVYGIVALAGYFAGGPLADRFSARYLISAALGSTALLGLIFAQIPSLATLMLIYAAWGLTTVLFLWAALLRATRLWGGTHEQGTAYGLLDGGRGLFAAILASSSVAVLAALLPFDVDSATLEQKTAALSQVILVFSGITGVTAILVWIVLPTHQAGDTSTDRFELRGIWRVLKRRTIWLQAVIVVCAYVGYKATDDFSLFARDAFGYDDVASARIGTITFWMRPVTAICAGLLADRIRASNVINWGFVIMAAGCLAIGSGLVQPGVGWMLIVTVVFISVGIYALRAVYFALLAEGHTPVLYTGTAIGIISVVGFTPDIFMGPWMGFLLDRSPGALGHQHVFLVVAVFAVIGLGASLLFQRTIKYATSGASAT